jgi:hypothetical protein
MCAALRAVFGLLPVVAVFVGLALPVLLFLIPWAPVDPYTVASFSAANDVRIDIIARPDPGQDGLSLVRALTGHGLEGFMRHDAFPL